MVKINIRDNKCVIKWKFKCRIKAFRVKIKIINQIIYLHKNYVMRILILKSEPNRINQILANKNKLKTGLDKKRKSLNANIFSKIKERKIGVVPINPKRKRNEYKRKIVLMGLKR